MQWEIPLLLVFILFLGFWVTNPELEFSYVDSLGVKHHVLTPAKSDIQIQTLASPVFENSMNLPDAGVLAETNQIDNLCVTDFGSPPTTDTERLVDWNGDNGLESAGQAGNSCIFVAFTVTATTATTGAITFTAGDTNFPDDTSVGGIALCETQGNANNDVCASASNRILFAVVDTSNVVVGAGETVDITYTLTLD